ncbi:MAG: cupin [Verrucomicrobiales bacterium]|nr:cupin [Verrucomicrobiales bacterium]
MNDAGSKRGGKIGIVILAAGASVRMGTPKQLLRFHGVSLIRRAAEHALDSGCQPVVVVLGANAELIAPELNGLPLEITVNHDWRTGMSSSIRCGLRTLLATDSEAQAVVLFLADQPNVTGTSLRKLTTAHRQCGSELVAAFYSGHLGTPALISRFYFEELLNIEGQGGAKNLLQRYSDRVLPIDLPEATFDLDTPEDFADKGAVMNTEISRRRFVQLAASAGGMAISMTARAEVNKNPSEHHDSIMQITRNGSQPSSKGPADWFTGTVRIDPLFQANAPARAAGASVTFEPGARTAWHTHPLGQTLIVTAGVGRAQQEGGPIEEIRPGDVVWFPPGLKHWHGAAPTTAMTHIAIQEALDGKVVEWMEKVTDEQYAAPLATKSAANV